MVRGRLPPWRHEVEGELSIAAAVVALDAATVTRNLFERWYDDEREPGLRAFADPRVVAYVKNDHLFCEVPYRFNGRACRYVPDFLVRLDAKRYLLVEGKGRQTSKDDAKETAARRWIAAVNADGRWGRWSYVVVRHRAEVRDAVERALAVTPPS